MNRRRFIISSGLVGLGCSFGLFAQSRPERPKTKNLRGTFSANDNHVSIYANARVKPTRVFHITDTHLSIDDERGLKYLDFSKRMAEAYKSNSHFQTGENLSTQESFERTLELAKKTKGRFSCSHRRYF